MACLVVLGSGPARCEIHSEDVSYQVGDTTLQGYLAYDDASTERRPGVLVVHEWWGLNEHARAKARALAEAGYAALAIDMYGEGRVTTDVGQAGDWAAHVAPRYQLAQDRFEAARTLLAGHRLTDPSRIAAIGYCFGGGIVLTMALRGLDLAGVVSVHGSLPEIAARPGRVRAPILVLTGGADPFVTAEQVARFRATLEAAGADWQLVTYGGARHSFTNPDAAASGLEALAYDARADRRSWQATLAFLTEIFSSPPREP